MSKAKIGVVYLLILIVLAVTTVLVFQSGPPRIVGFAIYDGSCNGAITTEGFWELNSSVICGSGNGIKIQSSNVTLECNNYEIRGGLDVNKNGIKVSSNLVNTTIQNCNITNFYNPVLIQDNSNLKIENTTVEANNTCVTGNWTDVGGNAGCLDTQGPTITIANQTLYQNESLSYQIVASDPSGISNYSISDNSTFSINSSGLLINITNLSAANYTMNVTVTDTLDYSSTEILEIEVLEVVQQAPPPPEEANNDGSNSDSSSNEPVENICGEQNAWQCSGWGECTDGEERRTCSKLNEDCTDPLPITKRACEEVACQPEWSCTWSECIDGVRQATECTDLNSCDSTTEIAPTSEACEELEAKSPITGAVISPAQLIKSNVIAFSIIIVVIVGLILTIVATKTKRGKLIFLRSKLMSLQLFENLVSKKKR